MLTAAMLVAWSGPSSACLPFPTRRPTALSGNPAAFGAAADLRSGNNSSELAAFLAGYPGAQVRWVALIACCACMWSRLLHAKQASCAFVPSATACPACYSRVAAKGS